MVVVEGKQHPLESDRGRERVSSTIHKDGFNNTGELSTPSIRIYNKAEASNTLSMSPIKTKNFSTLRDGTSMSHVTVGSHSLAKLKGPGKDGNRLNQIQFKIGETEKKIEKLRETLHSDRRGSKQSSDRKTNSLERIPGAKQNTFVQSQEFQMTKDSLEDDVAVIDLKGRNKDLITIRESLESGEQSRMAKQVGQKE